MILRLTRFASAALLLSTAACSHAEPVETRASNERSTAIGWAERVPSVTSIDIVSGPRRWTANIEDSPAARDFLTQLPMTLTLKDYAGNEKIADLPRPLTREVAPDAITPRVGDLAFYAPWGNLAVFYRDGHHSPGLIRLGRLQGDLVEFGDTVPLTVTIRQAERSE